MKKRIHLFPYGVWMIAFTVIPMLLIIYFAFTNADGHLTFDNILRIGSYINVVGRSLWYAFLATGICLLLSYPFAYFMARAGKRQQKMYMILLLLPMWTSLLLRTYAWMTLLENNGIINRMLHFFGIGSLRMINTPGAVVLGMIYDFLPFMALPIYTAMSKIEPSLLEAAQDLGANQKQTLLRVILPLSIPGVLSGITMVFVPAASTFVISRLLGGGANLLIGDLIEMQFVGNVYDPWFGSALSLFLLLVIFVIMMITRKMDRPIDQQGRSI